MSVIYKNGTYYGAGGGGEGADTEIIADDFDPTESYVVGDYVVYEGVLYKCTTAHTGAWDASDFDDTQVMAEMPTPMPAADMSDIVTPLPSVPARYHRYSTTEQIVGEWIDGKPVYEKTIVTTTNATAGTTSYVPIGASIDYAMLVNATLEDGLGNLLDLEVRTMYDPAKVCRVAICTNAVNSNKNTLMINNTYSDWASHTVWATIQYTKTTD